MSAPKQFNLEYYKGPGKPVTFDQEGRVDVFCAIHSKMHCIILVLPNHYFAVADERGRFLIKDIPTGTYNLTAWQERVPKQTVRVTVPETGEAVINFTLGLSDLPKE